MRPMQIADWLSLAAAPTFAVMAAFGAAAGDADMICSAGGAPLIDNMSVMYLMMSAFHLPTWLRLISRPHLPAAIE